MKRTADSTMKPHESLLTQIKASTTQKVQDLFNTNQGFEQRVKSLQTIINSPLFTSDFRPADRASRISPNVSQSNSRAENLSNNNCAVRVLIREQEEVPAAKKLKITKQPDEEAEKNDEDESEKNEEWEENEVEENDASLSPSQTEDESFSEEVQRYPVPIHPQIEEMIKVIKPDLIELHNQGRLIKTWVGLSQPKYEEGNNAGIEVLDMVGTLADLLMEKVDGQIGTLTEWYSNRGERVKSALAHGENIPEGWAAVDLADEMQFHVIKSIVQEAHDSYVILMDSVIKNMDRILKPRSDNRAAVS